MKLFISAFVWCTFAVAVLHAHDGPDAMASWVFSKSKIENGVLKAQQGPDLVIKGSPESELVGDVNVLRLNGAVTTSFRAKLGKTRGLHCPSKQ